MEKCVIGADEVGRGALAGPVVVATAALPRNFQFFRLKGGKKSRLKLRDSKKLSLKQREEWFDFIKRQKIPFAVASVFPKIIDKINISQAANLAAGRALLKLIEINNLKPRICEIFFDGGIYVKNTRKFRIVDYKRRTVIRGDEKIPAISLASIVAKVYRDKMMRRIHKKYPQYDFIHNVGYGTKKHIKAIRKFGHSAVHRKSFKI